MDEAMLRATAFRQAGLLDDAKRVYRSILAVDQSHRGARRGLGLLLLAAGRAREALPLLKEGLDAGAADTEALIGYSIALASTGDGALARSVVARARLDGGDSPALDEALAEVERVTAARAAESGDGSRTASSAEPPPAALASLIELFKAGRHSELESRALGMAAQYARSAKVLHLLGASRLTRDLNAEAIEVLRQAVRLAPDDPEIGNLLGVALFRLGRHDEARSCFEASLEVDGGSYETLVNAAANATTAGDAEDGLRLATQALEIRPAGVEARFNLGNALLALGRSLEAAEAYRRAVALAPNVPDLYVNLGQALSRSGRNEDAAAALRHALALRPGYAPAHLNLGRALHDLGETAAAQRHFRAASDLDPKLAEAHSAYLFSLVHDEHISPRQSFEEHVRIGDLIEAPFRQLQRAHDNDRDPERDLRIGFVSGDLMDHPVANLIEPIWRAMKGGRCRIHAYSNRSSADAVARRLRELADAWVQVERMSDEALCERIRADRIDILVDLSGHSARHRLPAFARRPAPVQVSWIGYPGTTGMSSIDYRFSRGLRPDDRPEEFSREKVVAFRHRGGFQPAPDAPEVNRLPALSSGRVTFAGFSRPSKLGDGVLALWSRVLQAVPGSTLLVAGAGDAALQARLRAAFGAEGIGSERLDFRPRVPLAEYMALHHEVDIVLDTFPYSGGTTAYHALWMGVPLLTLAGRMMQQNQSARILGAMGLSDWIVDSPDAYVARACAAAGDLPSLDRLRAGLRERMQRHIEDAREASRPRLEEAFRTIWKRWCAGLAPASFTVNG